MYIWKIMSGFVTGVPCSLLIPGWTHGVQAPQDNRLGLSSRFLPIPLELPPNTSLCLKMTAGYAYATPSGIYVE